MELSGEELQMLGRQGLHVKAVVVVAYRLRKHKYLVSHNMRTLMENIQICSHQPSSGSILLGLGVEALVVLVAKFSYIAI